MEFDYLQSYLEESMCSFLKSSLDCVDVDIEEFVKNSSWFCYFKLIFCTVGGEGAISL